MTQKRKNRIARRYSGKPIASLRNAMCNHPAWYEAYPLDHLMGINFGMRESLGETIPANVAANAATNRIMSAPDCMLNSELVVPAGTNAFMESMQILMNKLRAASGSNITYTIYDLAAYVLNARELYALYSQCRRTILCTRITDIYDQDAHQKYAVMSNGIITATTQDITANLASDTTRLNRLAGVISSLIPIKMSLLERTAWLFSNIFADSHTAKFSTKIFSIDDITEWIADNVNGKVEGLNSTSTQLSNQLSSNITILESEIGKFTTKVENSRIAGDLMKAFGAFFTKLEPVDETTKIQPIYDEAALTQIQNMSLFPNPNVSPGRTYPDVVITGTGTSVSWMTSNTTDECSILTSSPGYHVLNSYKENLSPGEIVSLTRLAGECVVTLDSGSGNYKVDVTCCGTELVRSIAWVTGMSANGALTAIGYSPSFTQYSSTVYGCPDAARVAQLWARDDWAPMITPFFECVANTPASRTHVMTLFDLSNWAAIDVNNLRVFHQAAVLSMTATPQSLIEQSSFRFMR